MTSTCEAYPTQLLMADKTRNSPQIDFSKKLSIYCLNDLDKVCTLIIH